MRGEYKPSIFIIWMSQFMVRRLGPKGWFLCRCWGICDKNQFRPHFISLYLPCDSASYHVIKPMLIITENILNSEVTGYCCVKVRKFTVFQKIFTNSNILLQWIYYLKNIIPSSTKRPVVLILGGCDPHYNDDIIKKSV